ncbi:hypothetical protein [Mariprofundus erugo]|uniref:Uncharacterized protein n=1 Tax=Mariprofundus erugo TaxID=2528639 RepID=A0A5R9GTJ5_9PROT|nr:hypothetical protein [Mariprofundus erugo]TLS69190.1 hypothetical protein FEF65_01520 [Mariprofundus erugo]
MSKIVNFVRFTWAGRIIIVTILAVSVIALYWSLNTRLALLYGSRSLARQIASVQNDIDSLKLLWQAEDAEKKMLQLQQLEDQRIMSGNAELVRWLDALIQQARIHHIDMDYRTEPPKPSSRFSDLLEVPVTLTFTTGEKLNTAVAYDAILSFSRNLLMTTGYRMEIDHTTAQGNAKDLQDVTIYLSVWMRRDELALPVNGNR